MAAQFDPALLAAQIEQAHKAASRLLTEMPRLTPELCSAEHGTNGWQRLSGDWSELKTLLPPRLSQSWPSRH